MMYARTKYGGKAFALPDDPARLCVWDLEPPVLLTGVFDELPSIPGRLELAYACTLLPQVLCPWLASCSTVRVVAPTVPETPGHHPQPRVFRGSDADHIMPRIVRRNMVGLC